MRSQPLFWHVIVAGGLVVGSAFGCTCPSPETPTSSHTAPDDTRVPGGASEPDVASPPAADPPIPAPDTAPAPATPDDTQTPDRADTTTDRPAQGEPCPQGACAAGLECVKYYGIAGPRGPAFTSCEIRCAADPAACPDGQACVTIADGPGQVCRPRPR